MIKKSSVPLHWPKEVYDYGQKTITDAAEHESLMLVRRDLHLNKQHQARYQRDVTNVINAMTSLVSDQQGDLDTMQRQVSDMTNEVEDLKKQVEILRRKERQKQVRAPQYEVIRPDSRTPRRIPASHALSVKTNGDYSKERQLKNPQKVAKTKKPKIRHSMTEMDLFEKRFQLA
ncbi:SPX domain-containing protein 1 [Phytophthora nicotianae]|uniref:SPX domain-containing protein 1 n=1 Tax=Phytophthora nicotianae TaxID=4792 RepID=A0A0W8DQ69_PHYNI|nr:SPX domain-containing protein 1 [Phytophthora nicotianae]